VKTKGALQAVKARSQRDWISIVGAGAIAAIGSAANMIVVNSLTEGQGNDKPYSVLEIAGVAAVTGVVSSGVRAAVDYIPQVNQDDTVGLVVTSLVGNAGFVASTLVRDGALAMLRGQVSINVEEIGVDA
jgi:ammonia channel protein AmtB